MWTKTLQKTEYPEYSVYIKIIMSKSNFYFCKILIPTRILIKYTITITERRALM